MSFQPIAQRSLWRSAQDLFQRVVDRVELAAQVGAEAVDHGNDRQRDARRDQSIFNGGGTALIPPKSQNKTFHHFLPSIIPRNGRVARHVPVA